VSVDEEERRLSPRARFSGITLVSVGHEQLHCIAGNLSQSGILIFPQEYFRILSGRSLKLTFTLPGIMKWIVLEGMLVRQARVRERIAWGVEFDFVPREIIDLLNEFVLSYRPGEQALPPPALIEVPKPVGVVSSLAEKGFPSGTKPSLVVLRDDHQEWEDEITPIVPPADLEGHVIHSAEDAWDDIGEQITDLTRRIHVDELASHLKLERDEPTVAVPRTKDKPDR
jgi:hypothetical protein